MYLAIDLGTTGCRSIVFDGDLKILGMCYEEYGLITEAEGYAEQDASLWWTLSKNTMKGAIKNAGIDALEIKGISISSQGITIVPVDENINPLTNAHTWLDVRAEEETERIRKDFGKSIFVHTGKNAEACYTLPKMLWFKKNEPEIFEKAYKFLMPLDFLTAKLCGKCITDHSMASGTVMYDIKNCCWSREILEKYNIPESKLPEIGRSGECAGKVLPLVAEEIGLSESCVVALGAQDQKCAAYGAGLSKDTITVSLGTAAAIEKMWDEAKTEEINIPWSSYCEEGTFVTEGVISTAGTCLRYVRDLFFKGEGYDVINKEAEAAIKKGSSMMFYPYLEVGEGAFTSVSLASERGAYAAAVMEGVAFNIRRILEEMNSLEEGKELIVFGGGARSDMWCRIIADVCNMTVSVPETEEAAGAGAARLAAMAAGEKIGSLKISKVYKSGEQSKIYEEKYKIYLEGGKR